MKITDALLGEHGAAIALTTTAPREDRRDLRAARWPAGSALVVLDAHAASSRFGKLPFDLADGLGHPFY